MNRRGNMKDGLNPLSLLASPPDPSPAPWLQAFPQQTCGVWERLRPCGSARRVRGGHGFRTDTSLQPEITGGGTVGRWNPSNRRGRGGRLDAPQL